METNPSRGTDLAALQRRVQLLIDTDPQAAVVEAKRIVESEGTSSRTLSLAAGLLVDAGTALGSINDVELGVRLLRKLVSRHPGVPALTYNLANGLVALARLDKTTIPNWYLKTSTLRHEARWRFRQAADDSEGDLKTQALTNLGNALDAAYRWAEAYDAYREALTVNPHNGVAAGCAAQVLFRLVGSGLSHSGRLHEVAAQYARHAQDNAKTVERYAGRAAVDVFSRLPASETSDEINDSGQIADDYLSFVSTNHLALTPTVEGLDANLKRWDSIQIESITEGMDAGSEPPPVFAMFNVLKADFVLARRLAFEGLLIPTADTSVYADTLDYAVYGIAPAKLSLAQRSALDILDRVAVLVNEYLQVGLDPKRVYFRNFWRGANHQWRAVLSNEFSAGNTAVVALGELAEDLQAGGHLAPKRSLRNTSTHRFIVLHDLYQGRHRTSSAVEHYAYDSFAQETIETLQVARSAILYLAELITTREQRRSNDADGLRVSLTIPTHHEIRGIE